MILLSILVVDTEESFWLAEYVIGMQSVNTLHLKIEYLTLY